MSIQLVFRIVAPKKVTNFELKISWALMPILGPILAQLSIFSTKNLLMDQHQQVDEKVLLQINSNAIAETVSFWKSEIPSWFRTPLLFTPCHLFDQSTSLRLVTYFFNGPFCSKEAPTTYQPEFLKKLSTSKSQIRVTGAYKKKLILNEVSIWNHRATLIYKNKMKWIFNLFSC